MMLDKINKMLRETQAQKKYTRFEFRIMVPNLDTLQSQTFERLERMIEFLRTTAFATGSDREEKEAAKSFVGCVTNPDMIVFKADLSSRSERFVKELHRRILTEKETLFLLIVDEAHSWAGKAEKSAFDLFVNGPFNKRQDWHNQVVRRAENAITLFVSATPHSLQTSCSQVKVSNELDMLRPDHDAAVGNGASYYGLDRYREKSAPAASKEKGGYITVDEDFEERVKAIKQQIQANPAFAAVKNDDDFIRTKSRGLALIKEYQAAMQKAIEEGVASEAAMEEAFAATPSASTTTVTTAVNATSAASAASAASANAADAAAISQCSELTFQMISDMLHPKRRAMILLRVKYVGGSTRQGREIYEELCDMQAELGLIDRFAIILASNGETAQKRGIKAALLKRHSGLLESLERQDDEFKTIEDLQGVPCIFIVCESGRMGDTFPKSMLHYDLRLRYDGQSGAARASFEQDLGRAFRYAKAEDVLPTVIIGRKGYEQVMKREGLREAHPDQNMKLREGVCLSSRTSNERLYVSLTC